MNHSPEKPFYEIHIFVCVNKRGDDHPRGDCASRGSIDLHAYLKAKVKILKMMETVRINQSGCLDRCELGPILVIYPEGVWYHYKSQQDLDEIIESHLIGKKLLHRLLLKNNA